MRQDRNLVHEGVPVTTTQSGSGDRDVVQTWEKFLRCEARISCPTNHVDKFTSARCRSVRLRISTHNSEHRIWRIVREVITCSRGMCAMGSKHNSSASSFSRMFVTAGTSANQSNSVESQLPYTSPAQRRMEPGSWFTKSSSPPPGNLPRRRTRSPAYGPRVCERSNDEHLYGSSFRLSFSGSSDRSNNLKARQKSLVTCDLLR